MANIEHQELDDDFALLLAECDEALSSGIELPQPPGNSAELRGRLSRGLRCVQLLRNRKGAERSDDTAVSPLATLHEKVDWKPRQDDCHPPAADGTNHRFGRFELRRELGRGGFGVVFLAYDPALQREVALKLPRVEGLITPELRERFRREAQAAARLDHPHIVQVHEAGELGPVCYIASAYYPAITLADWLRQSRDRVPFSAAAALVQQLALAMDYAHGHGVLHRDLKPGNILLTPGASPPAPAGNCASPVPTLENDNQPLASLTPKISDFGLAQLAGGEAEGLPADELTRTGMLIGTPSYMSPEQASGRRTTNGAAVDVYSLGAILYELVTGRPPFRSDTPLETLLLVRTCEPVSPSRLEPKLPRDLETICLKCLEKEPRRRYATAQALADDLGRFMAGRPIVARPIGPAERALKWARRRPAVALLAAAILLISVSSFVAVTALWRSAVDALAATEQARRDEARQRHEAQGQLAEKLIALADLEWRGGRLDQAQERLKEVPAALHTQRWEVLTRACQAQHAVLTPGTIIAAVEFSPDGSRLAIAKEFGTVSIWNVESGDKLLDPYYEGQASRDTCLRFRPGGRELVRATAFDASRRTGIHDTLKWCVWDLASDSPATIRHNLRGQYHFPRFSADARYLAAFDDLAKSIVVWDLVSGDRLGTIPQPAGVWDLDFAANRELLVTSNFDGRVRFWEAVTGQPQMQLSGSTGYAPLAIDPKGDVLAVAVLGREGNGTDVQVWNVTSQRLQSSFVAHDRRIKSVALHPSGRLVATASDDATARLWSCRTGKELLTLRGHQQPVLSVVFSPDGRYLATASQDGTVRLWDCRFAEGAADGE